MLLNPEIRRPPDQDRTDSSGKRLVAKRAARIAREPGADWGCACSPVGGHSQSVYEGLDGVSEILVAADFEQLVDYPVKCVQINVIAQHNGDLARGSVRQSHLGILRRRSGRFVRLGSQ